MGCDIHLTLERRRRQERVHRVGTASWTEGRDWKWCYIIGSGFDGDTWGDRIYGMFTALAGVRDGGWGIKSLKPRGFPEDATDYTVRKYANLIIPDSEYQEKEENNMADGYIGESDANDYISRGYSYLIEREGRDKKMIKYCTGPDWHTPSWCTTQEMEDAFNQVFLNHDGSLNLEYDYIEWQALLYAMKGYEASGEYECRAVFWFDN